MWQAIAAKISQVTGKPFEIKNRRSIGGGCINQGYAVSDDQQTYFVKINGAAQEQMFVAEALGLQQMFATQTIRVPAPIATGIAHDSSYIVMEYLQFGRGTGQVWEAMGRQLAALHQYRASSQFGWDRDNTIGSTLQVNPWCDNWSEFFAQHRIGYQLHLARRRGGDFPEVRKVIEMVQRLLSDRQPQPSLVHGDLWSGNAACTVQGEPVILDPATYWGDREVDLAMTELFGGFPAAFYQGYNQTWPLDQGYSRRKTLYNLYHILNHFNLFGGGYGEQARRTIEQLFRE